MAKKDLINKLEKVEEILKKKQSLTENYNRVSKKIGFLQSDIETEENKLERAKDLRDRKIKESDEYMSEKAYIDEKLDGSNEPKTEKFDFDKLVKQPALTIRGVAVTVLFIILLMIMGSNRLNFGLALVCAVFFWIDYLPFWFGVLKNWGAVAKSTIVAVITTLIISAQANGGIILGATGWSIVVVMIAEFAVRMSIKSHEKTNDKNYEKEREVKIKKFKEEYEKDKEKYLSGSDERKKEIKAEFISSEKEHKKEINSLKENIKEEEKERAKIEKEIKKITTSLDENLSLHESYQEAEILALFREYLEKGRCDNLKECINLYEQEKRYSTLDNKIVEMRNTTKREISETNSRMNLAISEQNERAKKLDEQLLKQGEELDKRLDDINKEKEAEKQVNYDEWKRKYGRKEAENLKAWREERDRKIKDKMKTLK